MHSTAGPTITGRTTADRTAATASPVFVSAELVHKANPDGVLLTGWRRTGEGTFTITAHWPYTHRFYATRSGHLDLVLLNETVRQVFPLLSHAAYDVPFGHPLLWERYSYRIAPRTQRAGDLSGPVELHVTCTESARRGPRVSALALRIDVVRAGLRLATAATRFTVQTPAVYRRLRAAQAGTESGRGPARAAHGLRLTEPAPPVPRPYPGRGALDDLALTPTGTPHAWRLRADTTHPVFFDHAVDHIPGLLLLEAARQAARSTVHAGSAVVAVDSTFTRFVELGSPCRIATRILPHDPAGRTRVAVAMEQDGAEAFSATVTLQQSAPRCGQGARRAGGGVRGGRALRTVSTRLCRP
ncbi:ScbA/BarX family gamma-butyrolactone biosynthesis protein [Streptomyces sp. URMC 124]|uniref:ScbA/BarX family gamma-butyrolactone biosynthesis protein n=1 Tax=Streptomyces sp. URMC 124 TaxID=3423405 RepID=UPI003F1DC2C3